MLDCGCNQNLDSQLLKIVETEAKNVDYILVSHASYIHVGALAYLTAKKIQVPVIGTSPVAKIGAQSMHELFIARKENPQIIFERLSY